MIFEEYDDGRCARKLVISLFLRDFLRCSVKLSKCCTLDIRKKFENIVGLPNGGNRAFLCGTELWSFSDDCFLRVEFIVPEPMMISDKLRRYVARLDFRLARAMFFLAKNIKKKQQIKDERLDNSDFGVRARAYDMANVVRDRALQLARQMCCYDQRLAALQAELTITMRQEFSRILKDPLMALSYGADAKAIVASIANGIKALGKEDEVIPEITLADVRGICCGGKVA